MLRRNPKRSKKMRFLFVSERVSVTNRFFCSFFRLIIGTGNELGKTADTVMSEGSVTSIDLTDSDRGNHRLRDLCLPRWRDSQFVALSSQTV